MKLFTGWILSAGLVFTAVSANAQGLAPRQIGGSPYKAVSDVSGPYAEMPPEAPPPRYYGPNYAPSYEPGYGPALLPPTEVYAIVRESGFSPLGIPQQRGLVYRIAVVDRRGDDGRLVIDARNGRIIRFVPSYRMGENFYEDPPVVYGSGGPLPPMNDLRSPPRPPGAIPRMASRTPPVPLPRASPQHTGEMKPDSTPLAGKPAAEPTQQSAVVQVKPADAPTKPPAAVSIVEAKPVPQIQPTQPMPKAQGLE